MRFIKFMVFPAVVGLIVSGCANHSQDYKRHSQITNELTQPKDVVLRNKENYYPLPKKPNYTAKSPSMVPPGSDLQKYTKKPKKVADASQSTHITRAKWSEEKSGEPILVLMEDSKFAWSQVGEALRDTTYQILDQDPSMSSYYILDTRVTNDQVTEKTPIYRVFVKKDEQGASKIVLMDENNEMVKPKIAKRVLAELDQHLA